MSVATPLSNGEDKARFLEAARRNGKWCVNLQNAPGQEWADGTPVRRRAVDERVLAAGVR